MDPTMRALRVMAARQACSIERGFSDAYRFALLHSIYPLFSEGDGPDPFTGGYSADRRYVETIVTRVQRADMESGDPMTFYQLEDDYGRGDRMKLVYVLQYAYMARGISDEAMEGLLSDCPAEARGMEREWEGPFEFSDGLDSDVWFGARPAELWAGYVPGHGEE